MRRQARVLRRFLCSLTLHQTFHHLMCCFSLETQSKHLSQPVHPAPLPQLGMSHPPHGATRHPLVGIMPTCRLDAPQRTSLPFSVSDRSHRKTRTGRPTSRSWKGRYVLRLLFSGVSDSPLEEETEAFCSRKLHGKNTFQHSGSLCPQMKGYTFCSLPVVNVGAVAP